MENFEVQESSEEGTITKDPITDNDVDQLEMSKIGSDQMRDSYGSLYSKNNGSCSDDSSNLLSKNVDGKNDLKFVQYKIDNSQENKLSGES